MDRAARPAQTGRHQGKSRCSNERSGTPAWLASEYPNTNKDLQVNAIPGGTRTQPVFVALGLVLVTTAIMFGFGGLVLLIACTNVANLLLRAGRQSRPRDGHSHRRRCITRTSDPPVTH